MTHPDAIALACALIARPSVTPRDEGALGVLEDALRPLGFTCRRLVFEEEGYPPVDNLYARIGSGGPVLMFAGHTDVVPPGPREAWSLDPFTPELREGWLMGRGASDMKAAIAAFTAACGRVIASGGLSGSLAFLITGDEEGVAINGTVKAAAALAADGERWDFCIVGEPTSERDVCDVVKIGRRGSLTGRLSVTGLQGHAAYPHKARNPLPALVEICAALDAMELDQGTAHFDPSNLEIVTIDTGNAASNVIPGAARAVFNIRFNDRHNGADLRARIEAMAGEIAQRRGVTAEIAFDRGAEAFLTEPGPFVQAVADAVAAETGRTPRLTTTGGTSDARFIKDYCPVAELGLQNDTAHQIDERVRAEDVRTLARVYERIIRAVAGSGP